ncbi:hypothetical protein H5410_049510 [Solanum commersonii]|uniref:Uncharacterized protein n=1 Tax=Solanum commersonii TaxID=4109 RepID=A0A9J5WSL0_SOLCO|nr:hypothetical protein H5410_049510 [Solanum commersonii]
MMSVIEGIERDTITKHKNHNIGLWLPHGNLSSQSHIDSSIHQDKPILIIKIPQNLIVLSISHNHKHKSEEFADMASACASSTIAAVAFSSPRQVLFNFHITDHRRN